LAETTELETPRLRLRRWRDDDLEPFAALNADPCVMRHFPSLLSREESDAAAARIRAFFDERGFGLWAVEVPGASPFIGFVGLSVPRFSAPFTPCVEVGWRLGRAHWGRGYALEAATAALDDGFERMGLDEIVAMTTVGNDRSRRVMERLGMVRDPSDDFDHPLIPIDSPVRRHVLYRIGRRAWVVKGSPWRKP